MKNKTDIKQVIMQFQKSGIKRGDKKIPRIIYIEKPKNKHTK